MRINRCVISIIMIISLSQINVFADNGIINENGEFSYDINDGKYMFDLDDKTYNEFLKFTKKQIKGSIYDRKVVYDVLDNMRNMKYQGKFIEIDRETTIFIVSDMYKIAFSVMENGSEDYSFHEEIWFNMSENEFRNYKNDIRFNCKIGLRNRDLINEEVKPIVNKIVKTRTEDELQRSVTFRVTLKRFYR